MTDTNDESGDQLERDPAMTDPEHYTVIFENERVRVLEYRTGQGRAHIGIATRTASCTP